MICQACGNQLSETERFCTKCGSPVTRQPESEQQSQYPQQTYDQQYYQQQPQYAQQPQYPQQSSGQQHYHQQPEYAQQPQYPQTTSGGILLREKDLTPDRTDVFVKVAEGETLTLSDLQEDIRSSAEEFGIAISFGKGQLQAGGAFNKTVQDCLIIFHPEHPYDYFRKATTVRNQGNMYYVSVYYYGRSKQIGNAQAAVAAKDNLKEGLWGGGGGWAIAGAARAGLKSIGGNKLKLQAEYDYYHALARVFDDALGGKSLTV